MELGALLKQARLDAGLSQRQLCGDQITRNMLSQIENGTARPSMETLRYLAARLGKPISYFLEENTVPPQILQAREAWANNDPAAALRALEDSADDAEGNLLRALCCLSLAQTAISDGRLPYAKTLLEKAAAAGSASAYYTPALERQRLLLLAKIQPSSHILKNLPDDELLLRAWDAYQTGDLRRCAALLDSAADQSAPDWNILRGDACFALEDYAQARKYYLNAEEQALRQLEKCCEKLGDYKMAYHYACKQRSS